MIIYDLNGDPIGNIVSSEYVGMMLEVDVYLEEYDNTCSSILVIKDKLAPVFVCDTVTTSCASDILPGSFVPNNLAYNIKPQFNDIVETVPFSKD